MAEQAPDFVTYTVKTSAVARQALKQLQQEALLALYDFRDLLQENPDPRPDRTQALSRDGRIRVYTHPHPLLEIIYQVDPDQRAVELLHVSTPKGQVTTPVFISYCHKDAEWLTKLKMFLGPLEDQGMIRVWDDTDIKPGSKWLDEIRQSLESARVAVFLITQNFLNSPFIREQELPALLKKAQDRGCQIFWIAVSTSTVEDTQIAQFQAANDPKQPLDTLTESQQNQVLKKIYDLMKEAVRT